MITKTTTALLFAIGTVVALPSHAAPPPPPPPTDCQTSEVLLGTTFASECFGYFGLSNSNGTSELTQLNVAAGGGGSFTEVFRNGNGGGGSGIFDSSIKLTVTGLESGLKTDTWIFSWEDTNGTTLPNFDYFIDLVFSFKAGSDNGQSGGGIAYFLFDDYKLTKNPTSVTGTYDFRLTTNRGLSHNGLYARIGQSTDYVCIPGVDCPDLPEPGTIALLGIGLLGFSLKQFKKNLRT